MYNRRMLSSTVVIAAALVLVVAFGSALPAGARSTWTQQADEAGPVAWQPVFTGQNSASALGNKVDAQLSLAYRLWQESSTAADKSEPTDSTAKALKQAGKGLSDQFQLQLDGSAAAAHVLVQTTDNAKQLEDLGIRIEARVGDVATALIPFDRLPEVAGLASVVKVEASQRYRPLNDVSVPETNAPQVWNQLGNTGAGVIVGVIDSGIDHRHLDFVKPDGSTRIKAMLDFSDPGDPDSDGALNGSGPSGGTEYSEAQINTALSNPGWFFSAADTPRDIPDNNTTGTTSQITVPDSVAISSAAAELYIVHPYRGDLVVTLTCPSGTAVTLVNRTGGSRDDIIGTFPFTGCNGQSSSGAWRLNVSDRASGDRGTLVLWSLHINRPVRMTDQVGHGTHVAGSAAGNGRATGNGVAAGTYRGMAPDADLIVVRGTRDYIGGFYSTDVVNGLNYIDQKAASLGRPYVINMSLGGHVGPHDGTSLEERTIDNLVGAGKPGKAIVVAAGNEGDEHIHASGQVAQGGTSTIAFTNSSTVLAHIDIWYEGSDTFKIGFLDPNGAGINPTPILPGGSNCYVGGSNVVCIESATNDPNNGDKEIFVMVYAVTRGQWRLILHGQSVSNGHYDAWILNEEFSTGTDDRMRVGMPGTARNAITTGAYVTKMSWTDVNGSGQSSPIPGTVGDRASFSSDGPTRDNRLKPDIAAPGMMICSSLSGQSPAGSLASMYPESGWICRDGKHGISLGTSMATPHVTGAVALLLHQDPSLDAAQLMARLTGAARTDAFTGAVPNNLWGYGKLDVLAAAGGSPSLPVVGYLPLILRSDLTAPTETPTPGAGPRHYEGTTDQNKPIRFDTADHTAVTYLYIQYRVVCGGSTSETTLETRSATGWPITDRQFEIRVAAGGGATNVFTGEFSEDFTTAQGTWLGWLINYVPFPQPVCSNNGTWTATLQP